MSPPAQLVQLPGVTGSDAQQMALKQPELSELSELSAVSCEQPRVAFPL